MFLIPSDLWLCDLCIWNGVVN